MSDDYMLCQLRHIHFKYYSELDMNGLSLVLSGTYTGLAAIKLLSYFAHFEITSFGL